MLKVRDETGLIPIKAVYVRTETGLQAIKSIYVRNETGLHKVFSSVAAVSVSPGYVSGSAYSKTPVTISTSSTTVNAPAGSTFAWASPDTGWSAVNPISAVTGFRKTTVGAGVEATTTFTCTVTLPGGSTATVSVTADVSNNYQSLS